MLKYKVMASEALPVLGNGSENSWKGKGLPLGPHLRAIYNVQTGEAYATGIFKCSFQHVTKTRYSTFSKTNFGILIFDLTLA